MIVLWIDFMSGDAKRKGGLSMTSQHLEILKKSSLFNGIETLDMKCMLGCLSPMIRSFKRNEIITLAGEPFFGIGLLLEGEATISKETLSGNRVMLNLIRPGEMFGEMIAFSDQSLWPATVQAQTDTKAIFIPRDKIISQCERVCPWHRMLIQNLLRIVSNRALMLNKKLEYLTIRSMRGKISSFLLDQFHQCGQKTFILDMNRNELADFLNVSRPSMSRELGRMRDEGLIDYHLSTVRILNEEALRQSLSQS